MFSDNKNAADFLICCVFKYIFILVFELLSPENRQPGKGGDRFYGNYLTGLAPAFS